MAANMNCSPATGSSQFRATRTWNALVQHLKEHANVKRRRNMKKSYDESFTGSNAVDVLFHFVKQNPDQFTNSSFISRDNIIRLCQSFIDNGVFEPIGTSVESDRCIKFEDSASALYHFMDKPGTGDATATKTVNNRQVLKEIDGDIRNSLDHISISTTNKKDNASTTPKTKHMLIPTRRSGNRSRFPSFSGSSAQSFKESFLNNAQVSDSEEDDKVPRTGRRLKRSSSLVGMVMKRSSSESNVPKGKSSSTSSASDSEHTDGKDKKSDEIGRGGKLRLSQRLTFRKKSFSSENAPEPTDIKVQASSIKTCHITWKKPQPTPIESNITHQKKHYLDPRRCSYAVKSECTKPPRSMRRMISTPIFLAKSKKQAKPLSFQPVDPNENTIPFEARLSHSQYSTKSTPMMKHRLRSSTLSQPEIKNKLSVRKPCDTPNFASPPKQRKRDTDAIHETPSRFSNLKSSTYFSSIASFANRMSLRKKAQRKNEVHSCVIKNPSAANGGTASVFSTDDDSDAYVRRKLSTQELSHLRRECVRVRLLQILDLQFVDSLITSPTDKKAHQDTEAHVGNGVSTNGVQYSEVASAYDSNDKWISTALKVLQHLPNGYNILCKHARDHCNMKKLKMFFAISEYYKSLPKPIIEESMEEIVSSLVEMLSTKPVSESLEATQLFLHLLPDSVYNELKDLVLFLCSVIKSKDIVLIPSCDNKSVILQTFPSAIFCTEKLDTNRSDVAVAGLFLFILEHRHQVFSLPTSVAAAFKWKRRLLEKGEVESPSLVQDSTFCAMISNEEFNQQRVEFTQMQVSELARSLSSDPNLPPKKKKDLLKKLQASHSSAYERSRGPMKATHPQPVNTKQRPETPQLNLKPHHPILRAPSSDPLSRRRNKSRQKQIYV
uniref:Uncharacterized protein LOC100187014 n=1 Tax=Phallusia mammillata TaxID=59560 RepID=A0A6F9DHV2_9ASCI|nr:uncharacterized protein LOC100187014 [Phallusia mammillata]